MTVSEPREHKKQRKQKQLPVEDAVEETAKPKKSKKRKSEDVEAAIEDSGTKVKEEKKKKRKEGVEGEPEVATDSADKSEKKKKRKHKEDGGLIVTSVGEEARGSQLAETSADAEAPASGGKKRKREQSALEEPEQIASEKTSKKSKNKKMRSAEHVGSDADDKKRKKKKSASGETTGSSDTAAKKEKKSKKRRNTTDLPNPESDESLSDQARKALSYAFSQFSDPPNWKFNKARQNWLLRNVWSDKAIPETYLPLSIRYLANVQGGVRENLIKTSRTHLDAALPSDEAPIEAKAAEATDGTKPDKDADATDAQGTSPVDVGVVRLRAQAILDALGTN